MAEDKTLRGYTWSVTINNPTDVDEENIQTARQNGWSVDGQLEKGESGTPHYQLIVKTKKQQRFSAIKKAFPRAHIELAKNAQALKNYVHKDETKIGELKISNEFYPSWEKLQQLLADKILKYDKTPRSYGTYFPNEEMPLHNSGKFQWKWTIENLQLHTPKYNKTYHEQKQLEVFDELIGELIQEGYYVEGIANLPINRSSIKKFWDKILTRTIWTEHKKRISQSIDIKSMEIEDDVSITNNSEHTLFTSHSNKSIENDESISKQEIEEIEIDTDIIKDELVDLNCQRILCTEALIKCHDKRAENEIARELNAIMECIYSMIIEAREYEYFDEFEKICQAESIPLSDFLREARGKFNSKPVDSNGY